MSRLNNNYTQFRSSALRDASLAPASLRTYDKNLSNFLSHTHLSPQRFFSSPSSRIDTLLSHYIEHLHSIGAPFDYASHALNGAVFRRPDLKHKLGMARQTLKGWQRTKHSTSHPPLTWELTVLIAVTQAKWGYHGCAVATLLAFHCYLRVGELTRLQRSDIVMPSDSRMGSGYDNMALRLGRTKTGNNQWVSIHNQDVSELLIAWMHQHSRSSSGTDLVFPFTPAHFRHLLHNTVQKLGLGPTPYVPHSLRHGGATYDYMRRVSIEDIMLRGRWKAMESARRYIQQGRAMLVQQTVPAHLHQLGITFSQCLSQIMQHIINTVPEKQSGKRRTVSFASP